jgi:maleylacetoacetate isomerase
MTNDITLWDYFRSSASYRVRIALNLAGLDYRKNSVNLLEGEHRSDDHLARSPQGLVPVLDIDGVRVTQSLAMLDYLDETRKLGLNPGTPAQRARVRAAAMAIAVDLHPVCNLSVVKHATGGEDPGRTEWMRHFITPGLRAFEALITAPDFKIDDGPYAAGSMMTVADICLMPQIYNADRWGADYSDCARIIAVRDACLEHPAVIAAHPDNDKP